MAGIHLHPHDILDEGIENIYRHLAKMGHIKTLFPQVNTIFERNPNPIGHLPHNPVHPVVMGNGKLYAPIDPQSVSPRLYQVGDQVIQDHDPLQMLLDFNQAQYQVIPWVNIFNGQFAGEIQENAIYDFRGNIVKEWLCPNSPDVLPMWTKTLRLLAEKYGFHTFMIDRIRYPDWSGKHINPQELFTCFCSHCQSKMKHQGIEPKQVILEMEQIASMLKKNDFQIAVDTYLQSTFIQNWLRFRQNSITQFVQSLQHQTPELTYWIDLWPPAYSWILGQDYQELTKISKTLKHFPYHKLGGGADVQGFIEYFAKDEPTQEAAYHAFGQLFNLPFKQTYQEFKRFGFPIQFVQAENLKARILSQPGTFIYSGIQMWNISNEHLSEAIQAGRSSEADDLIYYCYGWAELRHFKVIESLTDS
ncbi:hypothetical protein SAMN05444392_101703 [Seinonella peptonophila]|uniref:Glycosyl hydrolase-like 10 n=1 Tax=Seinonella peptonophila TaxID=112248 RepID=A0A1M4TY22_9BACL|nr:hypothetical protein [Seinonella peptonophila]SHE49328.1 hypothetical protein SAMN05444392_101703 [Seinonella peptonophila]